MENEKIVFCEICDKSIKIYKEKISINGKKSKEIYLSNEGVYFEDGNVWFCNKHWNEMTKNIFTKKNETKKQN